MPARNTKEKSKPCYGLTPLAAARAAAAEAASWSFAARGFRCIGVRPTEPAGKTSSDRKPNSPGTMPHGPQLAPQSAAPAPPAILWGPLAFRRVPHAKDPRNAGPGASQAALELGRAPSWPDREHQTPPQFKDVSTLARRRAAVVLSGTAVSGRSATAESTSATTDEAEAFCL